MGAIHPGPVLEREADEVARKALEGEDPLVAHRLGMDVHVQRIHGSSVDMERWRAITLGNPDVGSPPSREESVADRVSIPEELSTVTSAVEQLYAEMEVVKAELREQKSFVSTVAEETVKGAGTGALGASPAGPKGALVGGILGGVGGFAKGMYDYVTGNHAPELEANDRFLVDEEDEEHRGSYSADDYQ
ncbi:hypothetical protein [Natronobiforma cellulositropha]|uniref:hypothetical protein n=1 Tax=Natronobiforma cellulositropha TaxID=1679076 RepID=UPI0021D5C045|nr:hypothetical protein [Natronobiforma cellulositropha]